VATPAKVKTRTLADCEAVIERGLKSFLEVGHALAEIRSSQLYPERYDSFDAYCAERWGFTRQRATQLTEAAEVVNLVVTDVTTKSPLTEFVARPLAALKANPDLLRQTWSAIGQASETPTAALVAAVVSRAKVAITSASQDLSEFLATIVEQELEKIEAEKARKAAAGDEPRVPAPTTSRDPQHVLFACLDEISKLPHPKEMFDQIEPVNYSELDPLDLATDYLVELRSRWNVHRAESAKLLTG